MNDALLSLLVFTPVLGAIALAFLPSEDEPRIQRSALGFSLVPFALSLVVLALFEPTAGDFQLVERRAWIPELGVQYLIGIDGVSLFLVLLTTLLTPLVVLYSWGDVHRRPKEYMMLLLVLETGMLGTLVALDLVLFYVFWEVMLVPMYMLIGVWGGPRRIYAAIKFALFTMVGSLPMLVAILYLAVLHERAHGVLSFDLLKLYELGIPAHAEMWLFAAFALAFAIKVPVFPLHTWLPDAHVEAPTGGSVILAGVLLKMGTYGFLRFALPLFPDAATTAAPLFLGLAVVGILYGALVALVQPDLKKLVAYSSVSHLGFVMLGLFAFNVEGLQGAVYQMLGHGLSTGALFLAVGAIYERRHTREIAAFGGLWKVVPVYSVFFLLAMLSSVGLPGLNGFVGEFLILLGAFGHDWRFAAPATLGVILGACYLLWMYQRVIFGPVRHEENRALRDLSLREIVVFAPLLVLFFWMGVYPAPFLSRIEPSVQSILSRIERKQGAEPKPVDSDEAETKTEEARLGSSSSASSMPQVHHPPGFARPPEGVIATGDRSRFTQ